MIKLVLLGAVCAFLGSLWVKSGEKNESVVSCLEHSHSCSGAIVFGQASADQVFAPLAVR